MWFKISQLANFIRRLCTSMMNLVLQVRKKAVKEQKAERRKTKIKKHVKKRKEKLQQKRK